MLPFWRPSFFLDDNQQVQIPKQTLFVYLIAGFGSMLANLSTLLDVPVLMMFASWLLLPWASLFLHIICAISLLYVRDKTENKWLQHALGLGLAELLMLGLFWLFYLPAEADLGGSMSEYWEIRSDLAVLVVVNFPIWGNALLCIWLEKRHWRLTTDTRADVLDDDL